MPITASQLMVRVGGDTSGADRALGSLTSRLQGLGQRAMTVGGLMTAGVTLPLLGVGKEAVSTAVGYETSMNLLQDSTNASDTVMERFQRTAMALGNDLRLPGTSAADAGATMLELNKAGLSVKDTLQAVRGTLLLSAAANIGNEEAARINANALNMFGLAGTKATSVADLLAGGANESSASINDLALGMQQAGSSFASQKQPIDTLITSLALMSNAGIVGSDAGTSLKTMMQRLGSPTKEASGALKKLGIHVYDAKGQMIPMRSIIQQFSRATRGMSDEQRNAALNTIFGSDAIRAANILLTGGVGAYDRMAGAVTREGSAAGTAAARNRGLGGALDAIKSAAEGAYLTGIVPLLPALRAIAMGVASAFTWFGRLSLSVRNGALAFAVVLAAAGPVIAAVGAVATAVAFLMSPLGLLVVAVAGLAAAWTTNFLNIRGIAASVFGFLRMTFGPVFSAVATAGRQVIRAFGEGGLAGVFRRLPAILAPVRAQLNLLKDALWLWIQRATPIVVARLRAFGATVLGYLASQVPVWGAAMLAMAPRLVSSLGHVFSAVVSWIGTTGLPRLAMALSAGFATLVNHVWSGFGAQTQVRLQQIFGMISARFATLSTQIAPGIATLQGRLSGLWDSIRTGAAVALRWLSNVINTVTLPALNNLRTQVVAAAGYIGSRFGPVIAQARAALVQWGPVINVVKGALIALGVFVGGALVAHFNGLIGLLGGVLPGVMRASINVIQAVIAAFGVLGAFLSGVVRVVSALLHGDWSGAWVAAKGAVSEMARGTVAALTHLGGAVKNIVGGLVGGVINYFRNLYNTLVGGSIVPDLVNEVITQFTNLKNRAIGLVSSFVATAAALFNVLLSSVQTTISGVYTTVTTTMSSVLGYLRGINLYSIGQAMINGLIGGIRSMAGAAAEAAKGVVRGAIQGAKNLLDIRSPSRVFAEMGRLTMAGYAAGIDGEAGAVDRALKRAMGAGASGSVGLEATSPRIQAPAAPRFTPTMGHASGHLPGAGEGRARGGRGNAMWLALWFRSHVGDDDLDLLREMMERGNTRAYNTLRAR